MNEKVLEVRGSRLSPAAAARVRAVVQSEGVVVFPTETFYALGADPLSGPALAKVFRLKGRPPSLPLLVLLDGPEGIDRFAASVPGPYHGLIRHFWPGPLTLLFPAREELPPGVVSDRGEVALRVPGHALCRAVIGAAGGFLTGTSANLSGDAPSTGRRQAGASLGPGVDLAVDGGTLPGGKVSSLVTIRDGEPAILREGAVPLEEVRLFLSGKR